MLCLGDQGEPSEFDTDTQKQSDDFLTFLFLRLLAYDRNHNFASTSSFVREVQKVDWPKFGYVPLSPGAGPPVREASVTGYFIKYGRKHNLKMVKALKKGREMLDAMCVEACSILHIGKCFFYTGIVQASMKRQVKYWCKISISDIGEVQMSECECTAGSGAHAACKHLAAMAFLTIECVHAGVMKIKKASTERLQTFHQPSRWSSG